MGCWRRSSACRGWSWGRGGSSAFMPPRRRRRQLLARWCRCSSSSCSRPARHSGRRRRRQLLRRGARSFGCGGGERRSSVSCGRRPRRLRPSAPLSGWGRGRLCREGPLHPRPSRRRRRTSSAAGHAGDPLMPPWPRSLPWLAIFAPRRTPRAVLAACTRARLPSLDDRRRSLHMLVSPCIPPSLNSCCVLCACFSTIGGMFRAVLFCAGAYPTPWWCLRPGSGEQSGECSFYSRSAR